MPTPLPSQPAPETGIDDISDIDSNISNLSTRFISPIDKIRSISRPGVSLGAKTNSTETSVDENDFANLQINNSRALESRAHAFYRYLGLPVVSSDGRFYNPGFDPDASQTLNSRRSVNSKIEVSLQVLINLREATPDNQRQIFANQDIGSSIYTLLLKHPRPFKVFDEKMKPLDIDPQFFKVDSRAEDIKILSSQNPQLSSSINSLAVNFVGNRHILRPFIVDPRVENTVMPDSNKICVPFLYDKKATKLSEGIFLQRPGLELIIRQRLSDQIVSKSFLNDVSKIISGKISPSVPTYTLDRQTLTDTIEALSINNKLSPSATDNFSNFTTTQITAVSTLVRTIKAVIGQLFEAQLAIDVTQKFINWFPMPSPSGPETGEVGASLSSSGVSSASSDLDNNILELRVKKLNAQSQSNLQVDLGAFASPFAGSGQADSVDLFSSRLKELEEKRNGLAQDAFKAMGMMEIISGEISGLGLIDILCIYMALWSIDNATLINFLDNEAFQRMIVFNPEFLNVSEVSARSHGATIDMITVLSTFESKLSIIFSWVDQLLTKQSKSPLSNVKGSV